MKEGLLEKIKSRGYWRVNFQPLVAEEKLRLSECLELVETNHVQLRGWYYPHFPRRFGDEAGLEPRDSFYEGWIDFAYHTEFWRMYQSGQFLHYKALKEDWLESDGVRTYRPMAHNADDGHRHYRQYYLSIDGGIPVLVPSRSGWGL